MKIGIAIPVHQDSMRGNEITALRWKSIMEELLHEVVLVHDDTDESESDFSSVDCLIALHAVRSNSVVKAFKVRFPERTLMVCLTGTDLHGVFESDPSFFQEQDGSRENESHNRQLAYESLELADQIILLEPRGQAKVPQNLHANCSVIFQSADVYEGTIDRDKESFLVSVIGHLRKQKDPMLAAFASRELPPESKVRLLHVGEILEEEYEAAVENELKINPRYQWMGKVGHQEALRLLASSDATVLSSIHEGAPSVISEAVVNHVPLLVSRIEASLGLLGEDYPGFFEVRDVSGLRDLLWRMEGDKSFQMELSGAMDRLRFRFERQSEIDSWRKLLEQFGIE